MVDERQFADKTVLITGGSRGLGRQMAHGFAAEGARVVVVSRNEESCVAVADELRAEHGVEAIGIGCHVGRWAALDELVDRLDAAAVEVDVLVNNAGMSPLYDSLTGVSEALWDKTFAVNVRAPFRLSALLGERMVARGGGSIVNISSIGSIRPGPEMAPYVAAKAGLNVLTEVFAQSLGPTVRVNTIMAGAFRTDVSAHWDPADVELVTSQTALQRTGDPAEIVGAALFLAGSSASFTSGAILRVDGGRA
ncbi:SDR family oxidoreductase [Gordonia McavH-238-E]|uniref:SDR family NAD(P)-dependent oxidoreductase n=1 Tax=Gordonia sp. McavH-238-E TaxID=2917736 RepID=UPI001EF6B6F7|nr:SDR family oxidoreductase [Gordonia sp. McavH-238-E]MCG7633273.1 SDR family oxidoreductase [Gordonia sp. McavH-238-E]